MNDVIYTWSFPNDKQRGSLWYTITFSAVAGLIIWGFLTKQYIMSFLFILISGVYFFLENNTEENTEVFITSLGVKINSNFYDFSKIKSYSMIYQGENAVLLRLSLIKKGIKNIDLNIDNNVALSLKNILPNFVNEDENEELTLTDKVIRLLKL